MNILGISAFYHDSAACLLRDGWIVAAAQEERFSRKKFDARFPANAIKYCLQEGRISFDQVDYVGFYEKPHLKFSRILSCYGMFFPKGFNTFKEAIPLWFKHKFHLPKLLTAELLALSPSKGELMQWNGNIVYPEHHFSHAASAFFPSPFDEAAILTLDGVGEWTTTSMAAGRQNERQIPRIDFLYEMRYPDSLGMLYSAFTYYLGFKVNSGEYKVMGLAPYGEPKYVNVIMNKLINIRDDGSFALNMDYFTFPYDNLMVNEHFSRLFDLPPRTAETLLVQKHFDIAASLQKVLERIVLKMGRFLHAQTGLTKLCMAGGVALNCVANGVLLREGPFDDIWVQPAAGDAGGALGAAYYIWHEVLQQRKAAPSVGNDLMQGSLLGPAFSATEICEALTKKGLKWSEIPANNVPEKVAELVYQEKVVGLFQGRMEYGPRALGSRSIIGDARSPRMQSTMNLKIKYRESFRPFAPIVLRDKVADWFELNGREGSMLGGKQGGYDSPYMLLVAAVKQDHCIPMTEAQKGLFGIDKLNVPRSSIPAVTHVDYSARIQTVSEPVNPVLYRILSEFEKRTGVPVLVNTSFNVRGEPIVCSPEDAINCFLGTEIDALMLENILILKEDVPAELRVSYKDKFNLD